MRGLIAAAFIMMLRGSAQNPTSAQVDAEIADVRKIVMQYTQKLPDFVCSQVTKRTVFPLTGGPRKIYEDRLLQQITFLDHREHYRLISVDGKRATEAQVLESTGAISTGEFGGRLYDIFNPNSKTIFTWKRTERVRGQRTNVFAFRVPRERGMLIQHHSSMLPVRTAYEGEVYADEELHQVLKLTFEAVDVPEDSLIRTSSTIIEYANAEIAGQQYLLPSRFDLTINDFWTRSVNQAEFRGYRKFKTESSISFAK